MDSVDVVVIGGGIAGTSIAAELAADRSVYLLEAERQLGMHSTGRSAAMFMETYGGETVQALAKASRSFFEEPPPLFERELLRPRAALYVASTGHGEALRRRYVDTVGAVSGLRLVEPNAVKQLQPLLREGYPELAMIEPNAMEVDIDLLQQGYVRTLRSLGGEIRLGSRFAAAVSEGHGWIVTDSLGVQLRCQSLVNAAGAWCDDVATAAGVAPIGIQPRRRTMFTLTAADHPKLATLPFTLATDGSFYFKPESGRLLCSPDDEIPQPPGDAKPDDLDVARGLDAISAATTIASRRVQHAWAGLRSFVADRAPAIGHAAGTENFFWFVGQGGYGVQIAPAAARVAAAMFHGRPIGSELRRFGIEESALSATRPGVQGTLRSEGS